MPPSWLGFESLKYGITLISRKEAQGGHCLRLGLAWLWQFKLQNYCLCFLACIRLCLRSDQWQRIRQSSTYYFFGPSSEDLLSRIVFLIVTHIVLLTAFMSNGKLYLWKTLPMEYSMGMLMLTCPPSPPTLMENFTYGIFFLWKCSTNGQLNFWKTSPMLLKTWDTGPKTCIM